MSQCTFRVNNEEKYLKWKIRPEDGDDFFQFFGISCNKD